MAERSGRSADTARLPGCLGGTPPGPAAPHHSAQRGAAAAIALFIFPLFIRDISTSPLPSPGCRVRILAAGSQLTIFLGHLRVAQLGIGVFLFLGRVFKHRQVVLRVAAGIAFRRATRLEHRLSRVYTGSALSHRLPLVHCTACVLPCHDSCKAKRRLMQGQGLLCPRG